MSSYTDDLPSPSSGAHSYRNVDKSDKAQANAQAQQLAQTLGSTTQLNGQQNPTDFVEWGPPPDTKQRQLIFDSLNKIVSATASTRIQKNMASQQQRGDSRGTYVFTWGAGYHGQLGRKFIRGQKKYSAIPMMVELNIPIRQVCCGSLHTAVVTEGGQVYTWGDGRWGELGHAHDPSLKQTPRMVEMLENTFISFVACGGSHTVAITDSGQLYSWGWGKQGQTGHGDRQPQKFPKKIEHPLARDIVTVACGNKHTVAVNRSGAAISFGCGTHGQTGLGMFEDKLEPERMTSIADVQIIGVACGAIHTCLVSTEGDVYICGFGEYFHSEQQSQHFFNRPTKIDSLPEPIKQVSCGQAHNLALSISGNVYAWGSGEYGQIGFGIKGNTAVPRLVLDTKNIAQISAGRYHSFALTNSGILYSWGCGENGQLGLNSDENILLPTVVTPILGTVVGQVSCGEHHTAILTSAPWTKLAPDVHEWLHAAKVEHELKENYLKKTHRGLTQKDLQRLQEEMKKWRVMNELRKKELLEEEKEETKKDLASIHFADTITPDVRRALEEQALYAPSPLVPSQPSGSTGSATSAAAAAASAPGARGQHPAHKSITLPHLVPPATGAAEDGANHPYGSHEENGEEKKYNTTAAAGHPHGHGHAQPLKLPQVGVSHSHSSSRLSQRSNSQNKLHTPRANSSNADSQHNNSHLHSSASAASLRDNSNNNASGNLHHSSSHMNLHSGVGAGAGAQTQRDGNKSTQLYFDPNLTHANGNGNGGSLSARSFSVLPSARTQFLKETAQMIRRMTDVIHDKGEEKSTKELHHSLATVYTHRKDYDTLKHESKNLLQRLNGLKKEIALLQNATPNQNDSHTQQESRLASLKMQLNTVMIKISETSENRKNYELNIAHLKEEDFEHFTSLKALRKSNTDTNLYVKKMNDLKQAAFEEKDKSEAELLAFKQEIANYQKFVREQLAQFQTILDIVRQQNEKREKAALQRHEKQAQTVALRVDQLQAEASTAEKEVNSLAGRLMSLDLKLRHFEDSFQKISAATGLNNPDAIVNKFFFKGEIKEQLRQEIEDKSHAIELLRREEEELKHLLENLKLKHKEQNWKDVENMNEMTREITQRSTRSLMEMDRITEKMAFIQEGILHLIKSVRPVLPQTTSTSASSSNSTNTNGGASAASGVSGAGTHGRADKDEEEYRDLGSVYDDDDEDGAGTGVGATTEEVPLNTDPTWLNKGLWAPPQATTVFHRLESYLDELFNAIALEKENRHLLELTAQQHGVNISHYFTATSPTHSSSSHQGGYGGYEGSSPSSHGSARNSLTAPQQPQAFGFNVKHLKMLSQQDAAQAERERSKKEEAAAAAAAAVSSTSQGMHVSSQDPEDNDEFVKRQ